MTPPVTDQSPACSASWTAFLARLANPRLDLGAWAGLYALVLLAYLPQAVMPNFNADEIIQIQYPLDTLTILAQGRWGFYLVYGKVFDSNFAPVFSSVVGLGWLFVAALIAARIIAFRLAYTKALFVLVSTVSIYYGDLFGFDATRVAFPLANLLAVGGLGLFYAGKRLTGIATMALAPAFYPAASELAAVVLIARALNRWLHDGSSAALRELLLAVGALVASLVVYLLLTKLGYAILGLQLGERTHLDPLAALSRFDEIRELFVHHSLPMLSGLDGNFFFVRGDFIAAVLVIATSLLTMLFLLLSAVRAFQLARVRGVVLSVLGTALLLLAPYFLIFASESTPFAPRSLYAFASVHAFWAAWLFEYQAGQAAVAAAWHARYAVLATLALAAVLALGNAAQISKRTLDEHLAYQSDILATNRIIARIETLLADTGGYRPDDPVNLAVIYEKGHFVGPRNKVWTNRVAPWSREWIFTLIDSRYRWVTGALYDKALASARDRNEWPARDSVYLLDGTVVVVIRK